MGHAYDDMARRPAPLVVLRRSDYRRIELCNKLGEYVYVVTKIQSASENRFYRTKERAEATAAPIKYDPWAVLGRFFKTWVGSALYDGGGAEVDLEEPYEAFRALHAQDGHNDMLIRDYFAAKAMHAAVAQLAEQDTDGMTFRERADWAYKQADAMMDARTK